MARYKWSFDVSGVLTECKPIIDDGTSLDYGQQSGEVFYRAKLNGSLLFRFEFDYIMNAGYNAEHIVVLQRYDENESDFVEVWRGKFTLTDCEIDFDTRTISVTPETVDRYTKILDHLEDEYNLVKLAAQMRPVNILIRPCLQIYKLNSGKIANFVGGNSWESSCESVTSTDDLATFKFEELRDCMWFTGTYKSGVYAGKQAIFYGRFLFLGSDVTIPMDGRVYNDDGTFTEEEGAFTLFIHHDIGHKWLFSITETDTADLAIACFYDDRNGGDNNESYTEGNIFEDTYLCFDRVFGRTICSSEAADVTIGGNTYTLYDIASNDMAGQNMNYKKVMQKAFAAIVPSIDTDTDPTTWPQDSFERYFVKPENTLTRHYFAAAPDTWIDVAYWWYALAQESEVEEKLTTPRTIRDAYDYRQTIFKLLEKAGLNPQYIISGCLGGSQDYVGARTDLVITPRSNVISSYYDTPAQNAPISLSKIFRMLKEAYKCYWHIDENGNMHIEHVSYYDNGGKYNEDEPELLVDLDNVIHTRTTQHKAFGQNKVKYDKQDMPAQFTFGWGDTQTKPFDGYPINCLDNYVQKGTKSEQLIGDFDTDVDFVLSSPNDVSKDGFFLFALPLVDGNYSQTLKVDTVRIQDENGEPYEVTIQNADAAFVKIHETWWRYALPCENIEVNNTDTNAITTGRYKSQSLEFADTAMEDVIGDVDECNKVIRTQQGDGHIKTLSINLNSLAAKADLLFNFVGRFYYLRGTALGASIEIIIDNEPITIEVSDNKWKLKYSEPLTALNFNAADVVSVNFADCDKLESVTSCNDMFKNCDELLAVDFGGKKLAAVTSASGMFDGCSQLTTLICPQTSTWKPDLSFADCPSLTTDSVYSLLGYLYSYDSGVHTIDFNQTMWDALDADTQTDITTKAGAKGWTIGTATVYYINGQSAASTVYATINGTPVEIAVSGGAFSYAYNAPITSLSFENDADVTDIDFSLSDGLSGVTSLNDAFKNCAGLTTLDFTNCDLSNVATASDCFAGCSALYTLEIPSGTWQPDIDLSDSVMPKAEMLNVINGLYVYTSGTHTITFNSTIWDAMSIPDQQQVYDVADAKGWTTNAVAVVNYMRGTSSNPNGQATFEITFIDLRTRTTALETITVNVDANGDWEYTYTNKKIYSINVIQASGSTITSYEFDEDFEECVSLDSAFNVGASSGESILSVNMPNAIFSNLTTAQHCFAGAPNLSTINLPNATFDNLINALEMFNNSYIVTINMPLSTFANLTNAQAMFRQTKIQSLSLPNATFEKVTTARYMFSQCAQLKTLSMPLATFELCADCYQQFFSLSALTSLDLSAATFNSATDVRFQFNVVTSLPTLDLPNATYAAATNAQGIFSQYNIAQLTTINLPKATFESLSVTANANFFNGNYGNSIVNYTAKPLGVDNKAIGVSFAFYAPRLNYASYLSVANWVKDLTGLSAQTITLSAVAWNALSTAEQNNIDTIFSAKNWNRAIL